jgi:hypothetical protein
MIPASELETPRTIEEYNEAVKRVRATPTGVIEAASGLLALRATYQAEVARTFAVSVCIVRNALATNRFLRSSERRAKIAAPSVAV